MGHRKELSVWPTFNLLCRRADDMNRIDGVKLRLQALSYSASKEPVVVLNGDYYPGVNKRAMKVPKIPWSLCYSKADDVYVRFILGKHTDSDK